MRAQQNTSSSRTVFYVAASADDALTTELEKHLRILKHQDSIMHWSGSKIIPGLKNLRLLEQELTQASVVLLLISPDFLASDVCNVVMRQALELSSNEHRIVVPILLRPVPLENALFAHLECIPRNGRFVSTSSDHDEAFVEITEALITLFNQTLPSEPQTTLSTSSGHFTGMQDQVNRERLLKRVDTIWIKGVLEQWLHNTRLIHPDLHELPSAIENPWEPFMQETKLPERPFAVSTHIIDIYDKVDGALLILGKPGAGKTTLLLELLRDLLERAKRYELHFLPVFFNLASWAEKRLSLAEWLIEELQCKYYVSRTIAKNWVNTQQVLPLLDGLDMLPANAIPACVDVINVYRQEHNAIPIVICSRSTEYLVEQKARLTLPCAVTVQPLTEQQIDLYLSSAGKLEVLRAVLIEDEALHVLATTPLILSILIQTDQEMIARNLEDANIETLRYAIFTAYVESMLSRREKNMLCSSVQAKNWLAWLAQQMERHKQFIFYPGHIQPDWLTEKWGMVVYYTGNGLIGALLSGMVLGLVGNIVGGQSLGIVTGLAGAVVGGIGFAFASKKIRPVETAQRSSVKRQIGSLFYSLLLWLLVLLTNQSSGLAGTLTTIVIMLSLLPLLIGELLKELPEALLDNLATVPPDYGLQQSAWNGLRVGLLTGTCFGLLVILFQLFGLLKVEFINYWLLAIILGLLSGFIFGGLAALQLIELYLLLWRSGLAPKNYVEFLDYAADHLLLSKAGSGYMFRSPLLQDFFAALPPEQD